MTGMKTIMLLPIMVILVSAQLVMAVTIGASPGRMGISGVLQGGYAEHELKISTNSEQPIYARFSATGDAGPWITFGEGEEQGEILISGPAPTPVKITVQPPADTPVGNYSAKITFQTSTLGNITGRAGGFVQASVTTLFLVEVTGEQIIKCSAGGFAIEDIEIGNPTTVKASVINEGNVRIRPNIRVKITDVEGDASFFSRTFATQQILPTVIQTVMASFDPELPIGQYWAQLSIDECRAQELATFSIVEVGGIIDKGVLKTISNKPRAEVNETVEVKAIFQNQGPRTVVAKFIGNAKLGDKIAHVIETEEVAVPSMEETELSAFISPQEAGRYVITGRVVYNKKLTFEKGSILTILSPGGEQITSIRPKIGPLIIYIGLVLALVYIGRKVIQARRARKFIK